MCTVTEKNTALSKLHLNYISLKLLKEIDYHCLRGDSVQHEALSE